MFTFFQRQLRRKASHAFVWCLQTRFRAIYISSYLLLKGDRNRGVFLFCLHKDMRGMCLFDPSWFWTLWIFFFSFRVTPPSFYLLPPPTLSLPPPNYSLPPSCYFSPSPFPLSSVDPLRMCVTAITRVNPRLGYVLWTPWRKCRKIAGEFSSYQIAEDNFRKWPESGLPSCREQLALEIWSLVEFGRCARPGLLFIC